jgi:hypothetical protein
MFSYRKAGYRESDIEGYIIFTTNNSRYHSDHRPLWSTNTAQAAATMVNYLNGGRWEPTWGDYTEITK